MRSGPGSLRRARRSAMQGTVGLITYMRTDSTRVAARGDRRGSVSSSVTTYGERVRSRKSRGSHKVAKSGPGGARGDPSHDRWSTHPKSGQALPGPRRVPPVQVDLEPLRRLPDGLGDLRRDPEPTSRPVPTPSGPTDRCCGSPGWLAVYHEAKDEDAKRTNDDGRRTTEERRRPPVTGS